jgi:hypothetical protein
MTADHKAADFAKLPKWALRQIQNRDAALAEAQKRIDALTGTAGSPETDTFVVDYLRGDRPLPPGTSVRFKGAKGTIVVGVDRVGEITARAEGDVDFSVAPVAANVVKLRATDR